MEDEYAIAVIDIGMTNKKAAVYDSALRQLDAQYRGFAPKKINGLDTHDLEAMEEWFIEVLKSFAARHPIKAIAISAHGATFVCVGKDGKPALPCVYYTHEPGEDFHHRFYHIMGDPKELQARTGTPAFMAMINPAKGLFFAKEQFGEAFNNTTLILPYPQYWGFRFTGKTGIESTYMGNHTYLWDQLDDCLSTVARKLEITSLMPIADNGTDSSAGTLRKSWDILGAVSAEIVDRTGLPQETIVTMGIHDSNSALLPHFAKKEEGFIVNSTGTWCVVMNPVEKYGFAQEELGKAMLFNISAFNTPIKTAIFLGGQEFEIWSALFMKKYGRTDIPGWDYALYRRILKEKRIFLLPELTPGSGQFPSSRARITKDGNNYFFATQDLADCSAAYEELFACLRISLVMQTLTALERSGITKGCEEVYTEGGFRKDESYCRLLSSALKDNKAYLTDVSEAAALGAAMTAKMALTGKSLKDLAGDFEIDCMRGVHTQEPASRGSFRALKKGMYPETNTLPKQPLVDYHEVEKIDMPELFSYREAWMEQALSQD